jgi:hypothetical protein
MGFLITNNLCKTYNPFNPLHAIVEDAPNAFDNVGNKLVYETSKDNKFRATAQQIEKALIDVGIKTNVVIKRHVKIEFLQNIYCRDSFTSRFLQNNDGSFKYKQVSKTDYITQITVTKL